MCMVYLHIVGGNLTSSNCLFLCSMNTLSFTLLLTSPVGVTASFTTTSDTTAGTVSIVTPSEHTGLLCPSAWL